MSHTMFCCNPCDLQGDRGANTNQGNGFIALPVFVDEIDHVTGIVRQSIAMPSKSTDGTRACTLNADQYALEGLPSLSQGGPYVV